MAHGGSNPPFRTIRFRPSSRWGRAGPDGDPANRGSTRRDDGGLRTSDGQARPVIALLAASPQVRGLVLTASGLPRPRRVSDRSRFDGFALPAETDIRNAIGAALRAAADPDRAPQQQAYMKSDMPFLGVVVPQCRRIAASAFRAHPLPDADAGRRPSSACGARPRFARSATRPSSS